MTAKDKHIPDAHTVDGVRFRVLYPAAEIEARIEVLAREITQALGPSFLVLPILKGSFIFAADLLRALHRAGAHPDMDFLGLSSYGAGKVSSGTVELTRDTDARVEGRRVLVVDDILESGRTLSFARDAMRRRGAVSVSACVLLEKPGKNISGLAPDFVGFQTPDLFVVGYGMDMYGEDMAHRFRELPFIGAVES